MPGACRSQPCGIYQQEGQVRQGAQVRRSQIRADDLQSQQPTETWLFDESVSLRSL